MYLKTDRIIATIWDDSEAQDLVLRSSRLGTEKEFILDPTAVTGWTDGTVVRRDATPRLMGHGDFGERATLGARLISFSGTAIATTNIGLHQMRDHFVGMLSDGKYGTLSVDTANGRRYAYVGLEGTTSWIQQSDRIASWKIDLYAPDPFIYGAYNNAQTGVVTVLRGGLDYPLTYNLSYNLIGGTDTAQTIKNNGNATSWPVFTVNGDYDSGFTLHDNRGNVVQYTGMVRTTAPVTIDMGRGIALQNGVDKSMLITERNWFSIPPGETIQPEFVPHSDSANGSGWCDILYRDTWI